MTANGMREELARTPAPRGVETDRGRTVAEEVQLLPIDSIVPCPVQPRVNTSVYLVRQLAESIRSGQHEPVIEVEVLPGSGRYQIVCGEQRWRAARDAGRATMLALVRQPLSYLERLLKQAEENRLRASLDPVEEAHSILLTKTLFDIQAAEYLLRDANIVFTPLESLQIQERTEFGQHLEGLRTLLVEAGLYTVRSNDGRLLCRALSPWRQTEQALGISEASRKQKVGILRLPPELQEEVRELPTEHAIQISRLDDPRQQADLVEQAPGLTHRQVRQAVVQLRSDPDLTVQEALATIAAAPADADPIAFNLLELADLFRQLARRLRLIDQHALTSDQRGQVRALLIGLCEAAAGFE